MSILLEELRPGDRARIDGYYPGDPNYRKKLLAMGLTPNTEFEVIRRAPLGDPIEIRVRNFLLCLRQEEAQILRLQRVR